MFLEESEKARKEAEQAEAERWASLTEAERQAEEKEKAFGRGGGGGGGGGCSRRRTTRRCRSRRRERAVKDERTAGAPPSRARALSSAYGEGGKVGRQLVARGATCEQVTESGALGGVGGHGRPRSVGNRR